MLDCILSYLWDQAAWECRYPGCRSFCNASQLNIRDCQNSFRSLLGVRQCREPLAPPQESPLCPEDRQSLHRQLQLSSANTDLTSQEDLKVSGWLGEKTLLVSSQVEKVLFLHCVKTSLCVRNGSNPGYFNLYPKILCREGSPNKTIPNYMDNREMGLCSLRGRSTGDPTAARSSL